MATNQSSWKVGQWTTPQTTVTTQPVPSEVSAESKSQISHNISGQFAAFIQDEYPTFVEFVKAYYKSQELKGYCFDIINNWGDYYNIDNYGNLVAETELISSMSTTSTTVDVTTTRDFPDEGLLMINDEIIYYKNKGQTIFNDCARGIDAVKAVGDASQYLFANTTTTVHTVGSKVINLNNLFPFFMLGQFKDQYLSTYPKNFATGVTESTVIKRIKDFYASKGTTRSFQFVLRTLFGVDSEVSYPRDRIFKPSDAYYTAREVIRATAVSGNPMDLVGQVLYQENDTTDPYVNTARIYVKGVQKVFTSSGEIYEIDVDTNNSSGTFITPYKTTVASDVSNSLDFTTITVDSTLGWPEQNGRFRIQDEIITYTDKTVNQFLGCVRARENTTADEHIAGQEAFAAFRIYGQSNVDGSDIQIKVFGGTRGVNLTDGGKYYLPESKVTTPLAPGFDSLDPIWDSFQYNVRKALRGVTAELATPTANGSVRVTVTTLEKHRLRRDDKVRILNAAEDIYNNEHDVIGIIDEFKFEFILTSSPSSSILSTDPEFFISREFAFGTSVYTSINTIISGFTADVQNVYKSTDHAIVASTGVPSHKIGPFASTAPDIGNQRYLKRIPLVPSTKSTKTPTPVGQIGIGVNGVPFFSYKGLETKKYGGLTSITKVSGGDGYDILNPPTVEFEPDYKLHTIYATGQIVKYNNNRYKALNPGTSDKLLYPIHTTGNFQVGSVLWEYLGSSAAATAVIDGRVIAINVTSGGSGYTTQPLVSITGGGASNTTQATAVAQITDGRVTGINIISGGSGYTKDAGLPTISISGGGGAGAAATSVVRGPISAINITDAGSQFTYEPSITLKSGSGAVGYASILNGQIVSIIVTYGGADYFGAPDVIITGDGVGATAFAIVDSGSKQVTSVTVTNKGVGYTAGNTQISIVYPGTGANFTTNLTLLTYNEAATAGEIQKNDPSAVFSDRKVIDDASGTIVSGENIGIYGGEYGYFYNPNNLRYYLGDSVETRVPTTQDPSPWIEQNPTGHSPIIGWAYDGHPIYGPYGYEDAQNQNPYNSYVQPATSYRIKAARASILSGLTDPMGTFIEDYEYVQGLGNLDEYNGRYCVTPEYPNGVYAYFCTIDGVSGEPKFPYFIGSAFYSEADEVNWDGNGLQKNFTEDATRYRAPYIGTDNVTAKRKTLDSRIDFLLALEDSTTLITLESGEILQYIEDGIGYFSYYPTIRGGIAESLSVAATNRYSSNNIDSYLVEGGGTGYKVNDRLIFDNTDTGGDGVSATVSTVTGAPVSALNYVVGDDDKTTATLSTTENHYLVAGDAIVVSFGNNAFEREIKVKEYYNKFYFEYFNLVSMDLLTAWTNSTSYNKYDLVYVADRVYQAAETATSNSNSGNAPTHLTGTVTDGTMTWTYVRRRTDGNLVQDSWTLNSGGTSYLTGTYNDVPLTTNNSGKDAKATIVVNSSGVVTNVTITAFGTAFNVGDTISADDVNLGANGGSGLQLTLTETEREAVCRGDAAHQVEVGDSVWVQGVTPSVYDKGDYTVIRTDTPRRFTIKRNFASPATATVTSADVLIQEPKFQYINGHSYKFDTSDATLNGMTLAFSLDPSNTDIFTYKNVTEEIVDSNTNEQTSITIKMVDLPGIFYYFDLAGNNSVTGSYFTIINEPLSGTNVLTSKTDTTASYVTALEPETNYTTANSIIYSTNSIYPTGGVSTISVGDAGRNYQSLPQLTGSSRSGAGATAVATISGVLSGVTVTNKGSGYNSNSLPTGVCTLPDFVDLTLTNVLGSGSFAVNEIIISQEVQGSQTARGRVLSWDPQTSTVRIQPLQNARTGAANKGYIMFTTLATNADRGKIYSSESQANISAVSGTQAAVLAVVPGSGPDVGSLSEVTIVGPGSNYRLKPSVIFDDPYYGQVKTVTISDDVAGHTPGEYTGVTQSAANPVGGINVQFKVVIGAGGTIDSVTVTNGGSTYQLGSLITVLGSQIGGSSDNAVFNVTELTHTDVASTLCVLNGAVDSITVTNTGSGYLSAPEVVVSGGSGIQAKFNASIKNQGISAIAIESGGQLFQNAPVVNISQKTGKGASILLKSTDMGEILKIGGDNITFNYSHDRTLKPELNTTYNLQLTRTQVLNYLDVTDGGANFVAIPEIVLTGGSGSLFVLDPIIENEVIQSVEVINPGRGFLSAPTVNAKITHKWVALKSSSTLNFPYNAKIPTGTKVTLNENIGTFPNPLVINTTYYAIAATTTNGLADNQMRLATTLANAIAETYIVFTSDPIGDGNGLTSFTLSTTDLGDIITAYMKPANFLVGERVYQGTSTTIFTAYGIIKNWDSRGRVLSVEIIEGDFVVGEPVFGEESSAFGEIHAFDRAEATFNVSPISTSAEGWERTTGFLDVNEQRLYDSDRFQEYSYEISSPINISKWKNPLKFATHPAGFKVVGTQVVVESSAKVYRAKSTLNANYSTSEPWAWWVTASQPNLETFNGTTYVFPKPSAKSTGKFAIIKNFGLGDPDYTAAVPTEVQVFGRQLLDVQKILSCVSHKIDDISSGFNDTTKSFNLRVGGLTVTAKIGKTSVTSQFFVLINGIVQNPENYTIVSDVITFTDAPKESSTCLIMYYDRASYTSSFVLDQVGDEIKTFGTGLSGLGTHTFVSGVTNAITAGGGGSGTYTAATGTSYTPSTGVLIIEIGSHSLTTSNWVTIADGGITFTCDADNHASTHAYPRSGDPASGKQLAITAEDATTITVNVGISNNEPAELVPGTGYSDGIYNAVLLKNKRGSGTGATADITVTNGSVTNVKLVNAGNGYTADDIVGIAPPIIGEQLVKPFLPTNGTYNPSTGDMVLTIGSGHGLIAATTHTPTGATYDPQTGLMVVTIPNHGLKNGDQVKFADGAITFSCGYNGGGNESYPRSTDPISGKWILALDCTTNTFTVQVLTTFPSTNLDAHTYVTAGSNSVSFARSTVRIANQSLQFSCTFGGGGAVTKSYPRPDDPIGTRGRQRDVPVEAVSTDTITVNALNGTTPTNTDAHTWVGLSPYQFTPTEAHYTPHDGRIIFRLDNHGLRKGERIKIATNSLTFTCLKDDNATNHTYPRVGDPAEGTWLTVDLVTANYFAVYVGATPEIYKTYQPQVGTVYWPSDQVPGGTFQNSGTLVLEIGAHNLNPLDYIKIKPESLVFTCDYNGDNNQTEKRYPRPLAETANNSTNTDDDGDGAYPDGTANTWIPIMSVTATTITVYVGDAGYLARNSVHNFVRADADAISASAHTFVSADNNCIERAVVAYGSKKYSKYADAARLMRVNASRIATTAYGLMALDPANSAFTYGTYRDKCVRDTTLLINAVANNVEFGGNDDVYDAAQLYVGTIHLQGEEGQSVQVFNHAKEMCVNVMRNVSSLNNSEGLFMIREEATNDTTLYSDPRDFIGSCHAGDGNLVYASRWGVKRDITISVDDFDNDYRPIGKVTSVSLTYGGSGLTDGTYNGQSGNFRDYVLHADGSYAQGNSCTFDFTVSGGILTSVAPRANDDGGEGYEIGDVIYCRQLAVAAGAPYNPLDLNQVPRITVTGVEAAVANEYITTPSTDEDMQFHDQPRWLSYDTSGGLNSINCNGSTPTGVEYGAGPNSADWSWKYSSNSCQDVESTIRSLWGIVTQAVGTGAHTFVNSASSNNITVTGGGSGPFTAVAPTTYDNTTGLMVMEIGSHSLTTSDTVTITANSLVFTCTNDGNRQQKTYPRASDPAYNTAVAITAVTGTTITVNVGTNTGNLTGITRNASQSPSFQVGVADVTFDGNDKTFTMQSGGSTQVLPASDNFLIFLNSTLQIKGSISAYTYTGSEITFTEAPLAGMDFYGFYFGKLVLLDDISPFFDNTKATFTMKQNTEPFSLESDNPDVVPANNLMIFINGVFQEPNIAYTLNGSIIKFSEAPRANSTCSLFIYVGSNEDVFISNTFNSIDPTDRMQVASEGSDRSIATVSSASSVDTYEYVGLRPTTASFSAQISNGKVTGIIIDNAGSNYEDPPILLIRGGSGIGASATTTIQQGSGKVTSVTITNSGNGYLSIPTVTPVHPVHLERTARNRLVSNSTALGTTYLTTSINTTDTTLQCQNIYYDTSQKIGFPDEGEVLIPFYDTSVTPNRWNVERILYGAKNTSSNTLTVATGGRGYRLTTAAAHNVLTATYTMTQSSRIVTVTTSANHNFTTGENRVFLDFTSGTNINQSDAVNYITYLPKDGLYDVTVTGVTTFTITIAEELRRNDPASAGSYLDTGYPGTISGNVSLLPEVRLRSL